MTKQPNPVSKSEYQKKLAAAYRAIYAIGVLSIFLGLLTLVTIVINAPVPQLIMLAIVFFAFGVIFLFLGYLVQRKSSVALGIAVGIMVLNALAGIANTIQTKRLIGLLLPAVFLSQTWEGFKAIRQLKKQEGSNE